MHRPVNQQIRTVDAPSVHLLLPLSLVSFSGLVLGVPRLRVYACARATTGLRFDSRIRESFSPKISDRRFEGYSSEEYWLNSVRWVLDWFTN